MLRRTVLACALTLLPLCALAAPEPENSKHRTDWGLYLSPQEAFDMKQNLGDGVLFVDVREPIEIMFTGFTDVVDVNIPYRLVDPTQWHPKKPHFAMPLNPDFASGVAAAMQARGMDASTPVIVMCRSGGSRGAPSAQALKSLGLEQVYVQVEGFEGGTVKDNSNGPWRLRNGWKNAGLPWSYKLNPDKIYIRLDME